MIRAIFSNFRNQLNRYILYKFLKKILRHHRLLVNDPNLDISQIHIEYILLLIILSKMLFNRIRTEMIQINSSMCKFKWRTMTYRGFKMVQLFHNSSREMTTKEMIRIDRGNKQTF